MPIPDYLLPYRRLHTGIQIKESTPLIGLGFFYLKPPNTPPGIKMNTYVYIMAAGGFCKIGVAKNPESRRKTMQTGNPYEIKILVLFPFSDRKKAFGYERELHKQFEAHRFKGEWFHLNPINAFFQAVNNHNKTKAYKLNKKGEVSPRVFDEMCRNYKNKQISMERLGQKRRREAAEAVDEELDRITSHIMTTMGF